MTAFRIAAFALCLMAGPALSATEAELQRLQDLIGLDDLVQAMREEGLAHADTLAEDTFGASGSGAWDRVISGIYDQETMSETVSASFRASLSDVDVTPLLAFYDTEEARRIIDLELSARRALMDEEVEAAAELAVDRMRDDSDPRLVALEAFIVVNDLVELNVEGGLNSNLSFYQGMADGGFEMTPDDIVSQVWAQEPEIRSETETWLYAYLALAYEPLSDDVLFRYTDITRSDAGQALNAALFESFDIMYRNISYGLGRATAEFGRGEEL